MVRYKKQGIEYSGKNLDFVSFPLGGIGAGMICFDGNGSFSNVSLRHIPEIGKSAFMFATFKEKNSLPRMLSGPVAQWKISGLTGSGNGLGDTCFGIPHCKLSMFISSFPFATVYLRMESFYTC